MMIMILFPGYVMVQDMSMEGYPDDVPFDIVCGYSQIFREVEKQFPSYTEGAPISHLILQVMKL